ncbi:Holliday junction branch migration protein RuvA [Dietzia timorensis]|uniref:Holliday junction branch migration complex subunit RuvA n=1 Tax=Dietzia timorensis TaxID=499555 RepID=A0A173LLD9_9ACTN|nr:Holliday junction branch migration protein RuvA [Dietzia timorensis]ANI92529.1 Holliday junction ATP-dependent DNA helicase RuvA [Dietzia timorensis]
MISTLRGRVLEVALGHCVIEAGGVGLLVLATPAALSTLRRGEDGFLHTTLVVREDSLTLYGFESAAAREVFGLVQGVSGIGPRIALAVVATIDPADLAAAVANEDVKTIQRVPGVGKRTAERMILDLREKLDAYADAGAAAEVSKGETINGGGRNTEVVTALEGLGFPTKDAASAVATVSEGEPDADPAALLRLALKQLGPGK